MTKLLTGVFVGVFGGALVYEIIKRARPDWAETCHQTVGKVVDKVEEVVNAAKAGTSGRKKAESIPVE